VFKAFSLALRLGTTLLNALFFLICDGWRFIISKNLLVKAKEVALSGFHQDPAVIFVSLAARIHFRYVGMLTFYKAGVFVLTKALLPLTCSLRNNSLSDRVLVYLIPIFEWVNITNPET